MSRGHSAPAVTSLQRIAASAPFLSADQERLLLERVRSGERRALDELVRSYVRLVFALSKRFGRRASLPAAELVSEGLLGLVLAARHYELGHNMRFGAYAAMWIQALLRRYTLANRRIVRAPSTRNARRVLAHLSEVERAVALRDGGVAAPEAVARELGVTISEVDAADAALRGWDLSYDPCSAAHGGCDDDSPETLVANAEELAQRRAVFERIFAGLDPREQMILRTRYLNGEQESLLALGRSLGISGERVRQIERLGCQKLRAGLGAAL